MLFCFAVSIISYMKRGYYYFCNPSERKIIEVLPCDHWIVLENHRETEGNNLFLLFLAHIETRSSLLQVEDIDLELLMYYPLLGSR